MGIYIKGVEMPPNCPACPFLFVTSICDGSKDCPISYVPPHGRLIDADELVNGLIYPYEQFERAFRELIGDCPTIIERTI